MTALTEQLKAACIDNGELKDIVVEKNQTISKLEKEMQDYRQEHNVNKEEMAAMEKRQKEQEEHYNASL